MEVADTQVGWPFMKKTLLSARVVPQPSARRELLQALIAWVGRVRKKPEVLAANVYEDVENPAAFRIEAEWSEVEALEDHLRSGSFGALLGAFELLAEPARLAVTRPAEAYGADPLAAIRQMREGHGPKAERNPGKPGGEGNPKGHA